MNKRVRELEMLNNCHPLEYVMSEWKKNEPKEIVFDSPNMTYESIVNTDQSDWF